MNVVSLPRLCLYYLIFDAKPNVLPCTEIERIYTTCCEILQDVLLGKFSICTISKKKTRDNNEEKAWRKKYQTQRKKRWIYVTAERKKRTHMDNNLMSQ